MTHVCFEFSVEERLLKQMGVVFGEGLVLFEMCRLWSSLLSVAR